MMTQKAQKKKRKDAKMLELRWSRGRECDASSIPNHPIPALTLPLKGREYSAAGTL
jgi:hypothetical protein